MGGLWHSGDRGESWHGVIEPGADIHEVRAEYGSVAVAAAVGFGWSEDSGKSWSWNTEGLHDSYLRAVCIDGETAYVSASDGPFTRRGAVYRARLGSAFVRCEEGLPEWFPGNVDTGHLDAAGGRVVIGFGEEVHVSEDDGESWHANKVPGVSPRACTRAWQNARRASGELPRRERSPIYRRQFQQSWPRSQWLRRAQRALLTASVAFLWFAACS